jgi:hypothetical protein
MASLLPESGTNSIDHALCGSSPITDPRWRDLADAQRRLQSDRCEITRCRQPTTLRSQGQPDSGGGAAALQKSTAAGATASRVRSVSEIPLGQSRRLARGLRRRRHVEVLRNGSTEGGFGGRVALQPPVLPIGPGVLRVVEPDQAEQMGSRHAGEQARDSCRLAGELTHRGFADENRLSGDLADRRDGRRERVAEGRIPLGQISVDARPGYVAVRRR